MSLSQLSTRPVGLGFPNYAGRYQFERYTIYSLLCLPCGCLGHIMIRGMDRIVAECGQDLADVPRGNSERALALRT